MRTALKFSLLLAVCVLLQADRPTKAADDKPPEGFTSLFDGKTLDGWKPTGKAEMWTTEKGLIVCKGGGGGWLLTEKEYGDFEFRCQYRWEKEGGDGGIALRTPTKGDPAYVGMEIQLIDDVNWEKVHKFKLQNWQNTGSIYNVEPPKVVENKPIGEWNTVRIVCKGRKVMTEHNGKELVNANLDNYEKLYDKHPGLKREKGSVGFQSYNIRVEFKNIYLKELK